MEAPATKLREALEQGRLHLQGLALLSSWVMMRGWAPQLDILVLHMVVYKKDLQPKPGWSLFALPQIWQIMVR